MDEFRNIILMNFRAQGRSLPWRYHGDPWAIVVSEIMLQQTQIDRVLNYWQAWLERWPSPCALAKASLTEVLLAWSGLGYNRRARFLLETAKKICTDFGGQVPKEVAVLKSLPGFGPYTAGAVACFAYGRPEVIIETNIRSVFLHFFFKDAKDVHDRDIMPLIKESLWLEDPRTWYYALMDYGVQLKALRKNPSRQSAHYTRQSRFEGSVRQARGALVRELAEKGPQELAFILEQLPYEAKRVQAALEGLVREGLINYNGKTYTIAD